MGAPGRARVCPLLAPARGMKTHPCANRSPEGGEAPRGPGFAKPDLQTPLRRAPKWERDPLSTFLFLTPPLEARASPAAVSRPRAAELQPPPLPLRLPPPPLPRLSN